MKANPKKSLLKHWLEADVLPIKAWPVTHWHEADFSEYNDQVVIEEPFEIRLNGRSLAIIMRTPSGLENDKELAIGFLLTEGVISLATEISKIVRPNDKDGLPEENVLDVQTAFAKATEQFERRFVIGSSCGICGKNSVVEMGKRACNLLANDFKVAAQTLYALPTLLRQKQLIFEQTGGLHAAGLFDETGELKLMREDIGRHNAVDKIIGRMAQDDKLPLSQTILVVSGRVSFEIVQKAFIAQIPIVAAVSAPSSLALELADEIGMTLVGFLRQQNLNVYTHATRII